MAAGGAGEVGAAASFAAAEAVAEVVGGVADTLVVAVVVAVVAEDHCTSCLLVGSSKFQISWSTKME